MARAPAPPVTPAEPPRDTPLADALSARYLAYALSTITARSLPDARDGLKPAHRRLLFAMRELKLGPETAFKKCARIVGDVMGKYHPHGDQAIYDTLVRQAQDFAARWPLVDGQGNFGNLDGDNAAAMRYTEARMTPVAEALLRGIDEDAVDFRPTYDGSGEEPVVLPAAFPNLLANGAAGIAVGMATSIPPHNVQELCDVLRYMISHPDAGEADIAAMLPGPDFPTGGLLCESPADIAEAYLTGRGGFRVRARWHVEKLSGGAWRIVVTEIPWQVQKARLIERIAALAADRDVPLLADVADESAEDVRIVLEPRSRGVDPALLMESLFRRTELESRIPLNMNLLTEEGRVPRVVGLREALRIFLDHRHQVLQRRSRYREEKIRRRLEILDGYLACYLDIDGVIRIIRTEDAPRPALCAAYGLTETQADAVLDMRLRALRRLEEVEIRAERDKLQQELDGISALLGDESKRWQAIAGEIAETARQFGAGTRLGKRRTEIGAPAAAVDDAAEAAAEAEAAILREPVTVVCSEKGWIRALKGHLTDPDAIRYKDGDGPGWTLHAHSTDRLLVFATNGRFYTLEVARLPGGRSQGEPLRLLTGLPNGDNPIALLAHDSARRLLLVASDGRGFVAEEKNLVAKTRNGRQTLNLGEGAQAMLCVPVTGDMVAILGRNRKLLVFPLADLPVLERGRGVILQSYKSGGGPADVITFMAEEGLSWISGGRRHVR